MVAGYQMLGDLGTVTGPVAVGFLVDSVSYGAAFLLAAGVLGAAAILGLLAPETGPTSNRRALNRPGGRSAEGRPGQPQADTGC